MRIPDARVEAEWGSLTAEDRLEVVLGTAKMMSLPVVEQQVSLARFGMDGIELLTALLHDPQLRALKLHHSFFDELARILGGVGAHPAPFPYLQLPTSWYGNVGEANLKARKARDLKVVEARHQEVSVLC